MGVPPEQSPQFETYFLDLPPTVPTSPTAHPKFLQIALTTRDWLGPFYTLGGVVAFLILLLSLLDPTAQGAGAVRGFDTGPASALLDGWAARHLGQPYDDGGRWAAGGSVLPPLLQRLLAEPFFAASIVGYSICVGAGDTLRPAFMNLLSMWCVRLTLAYFLAQDYGLKGVWIAMAIELTFRGLIFLWRIWRGNWMKAMKPAA